MLKPRLAELKRQLSSKGYPSRTGAEDELLKELEELDNYAVQKGFAKDARMTSGPTDRCPTCGR